VPLPAKYPPKQKTKHLIYQWNQFTNSLLKELRTNYIWYNILVNPAQGMTNPYFFEKAKLRLVHWYNILVSQVQERRIFVSRQTADPKVYQAVMPEIQQTKLSELELTMYSFYSH
jgi:hypothetical protein